MRAAHVVDLESELSRNYLLATADVRPHRARDLERTIALLVVLEDRDHETRECETRGVEDMDVLGLAAGLAPEADVRALGLERSAIRSRRDFEPLVLCGTPGIHVKATHHGEPKIAGAAFGDADRELELFEHLDRERGQLVEPLRRLLR